MEALTTAEGIAALITGGVAIIGTVSATLHKLGIVTLRSPLKGRSNGRGETASSDNPGIPNWCADLRKSCVDTNERHFTVLNTTLERIEGKQENQGGILGNLKGEVAQLVSAYRESNGQAGIVVENLKGRVVDLEREKDGFSDK